MSFLKRTAFSVAEYFTPVLTTSQFYKTGQLTPEEFVVSGDQLASKCTSWHWGTGTGESVKDYLPKDKQYLYTKGVVCVARASTVSGAVLEESPAEDEWVLTTNKNNDSAPNNDAKTDQQGQPDGENESNDADEIPDLDDLDYGDLGEAEEAPAPTTGKPTQAAAAATGVTNIRTYDVSVIYDKLYRCPRVYLQGYDSNGKLLSEQQVQQDMSGDHMNKTVTWEIHPYTNLPCMSIHPCQHAHTMKRMLEIMVYEETELINLEQKALAEKHAAASDKNAVLGALQNKNDTKSESNNEAKRLHGEKEITEEAWIRVQNRMTIDKALFLFLKFVATVIPTIDYDNTINFDIF